MSYLQVSTHPQSRNLASIFPLVYSASQSTISNGDASTLGTYIIIIIIIMVLTLDYSLEYHLPDGTVY